MLEIMANKAGQAHYLMNLLGRKRVAVVTETQSSELRTMMALLDNYKVLQAIGISDVDSQTVRDQQKVEVDCAEIYEEYLDDGFSELPVLHRANHMKFLNRAIDNPLSGRFISLDASQTWIIYWLFNSFLILGGDISRQRQDAIAAKILLCESPEGGLGGGKGQMGHIASTYAGTLALSFTDEKAWEQIDRKKMYRWLLEDLKQPDGSFAMHVGGEKDTRAVYCALTVASIYNILTPELVKGTAEWISKCQTFEGGFSGVPDSEAHGGYGYCAVASLCLLGEPKKMLQEYCNLPKLIEWTVQRQMSVEGGFSGRSNKLVDGCYGHWVGGMFPFLEMATGHELFSRQGLQTYLLGCCQGILGGLLDKPGRLPDFYHTNYTILGLSHCQHRYEFDGDKYEKLKKEIDGAAYCCTSTRIGENEGSQVKSVNPIFGSASGYVEKMRDYYS